MINMLFNLYNYHEDWARDIVGEYISPEDKVLIIPFSFGPEVRGKREWRNAYSKHKGEQYESIIEPFLYYGIQEKDIKWLNYYTDTSESAKEKIKDSTIIFITGGFPDKLKSRLIKFDLVDELENYQGIMIGTSAGAMIQIAQYHITQDDDYSTFKYLRGLNIIKDFDIEVHYEGRDVQNESIERVLYEKKNYVYAITDNSGVIYDNGEIILLGEAEEFTRE